MDPTGTVGVWRRDLKNVACKFKTADNSTRGLVSSDEIIVISDYATLASILSRCWL